MSLHCNDVSHWLGTYLDRSLEFYVSLIVTALRFIWHQWGIIRYGTNSISFSIFSITLFSMSSRRFLEYLYSGCVRWLKVRLMSVYNLTSWIYSLDICCNQCIYYPWTPSINVHQGQGLFLNMNINDNDNVYSYSISQEICTQFLLCCALLWLYIDWFSHIHQAYFTGTVAI